MVATPHPKPAAKKAGRPSSFTAAKADAICARLAEGESLRSICRGEAMPSASAVFDWLAADASFAEQYARAKAAGIEAMADEIAEIADDGRNDWMARNGEGAVGYELNGEHVQRSKLRVDARKWLLSKLAPKKYGDKLEHEVTGANGGPLSMVVEYVTATAASE